MEATTAGESADEIMTPHCPTFQAALELVGRRWTGAIIRSMLYGSARFSDIMSQIPGLSDRLLSERLRELESAGLVLRTVYPLTPVRIEYALTEKGRELREVLIAIDHWASRWAGTPSVCASAEAGFAAEAAHACVQPDA